MLREHDHSAELLTEDMEEMKKTFLDWEKAQFELAERLKQQRNGKYQPKKYTTEEKAKTLNEWEDLKAEKLNEIQGACQPEDIRFLKGFLLAPFTTQAIFDVIELFVSVDGCHTSHGTLFSVYAITANGNTILLAHGHFYGNETKASRLQVFEFVKKNYEDLDCAEATFPADQDKGLLEALLRRRGSLCGLPPC